MTSALFSMPVRSAAFDAALEGLTRLNETLMGEASIAGKAFPPLYSSGVRYRTEPTEVWRHVDTVLTEGWGDCEDLSAYRAAELRLSGEDPDAKVHTYRSGPRRYHAVVRRGNGTLEDPSAKLGMKTKETPVAGEILGLVLSADEISGALEEEGIFISQVQGLADCMGTSLAGGATFDILGADPTPEMQEISFDVRRIPGKASGGFFGGQETTDGWVGVVRIPLSTGKALLVKSSVVPESAPVKTQVLPAQPYTSPMGPYASQFSPASSAAPKVVPATTTATPPTTVTLSAPQQAVSKALSLATKALSASGAAQALLPAPAKLALNVLQSPAARAIAVQALKLGPGTTAKVATKVATTAVKSVGKGLKKLFGR